MVASIAVATTVLTLAPAGQASAPTQVPGQKHSDSKRMDAILGAVRDRVSQQNDTWFGDGDFPRTIQSLRVLHTLFPHDYGLTTDLGWMLENVENYTEALGVYIAYRLAYPEDPEAAYPEAELYYRRKLYSKVPGLIEPSLKLATHPHPNSFRILAGSYERLKQFKDSQRIWDEYLRLSPNDGQAKVNRARVTKKMLTMRQPQKGRLSTL